MLPLPRGGRVGLREGARCNDHPAPYRLILCDQAAAGLEPEGFEAGDGIRLCDEVVAIPCKRPALLGIS
jgi:hypothetical protein